MIRRLKDFRRVCARYDKLYLGFGFLAPLCEAFSDSISVNGPRFLPAVGISDGLAEATYEE